jgi:hypothetical protein
MNIYVYIYVYMYVLGTLGTKGHTQVVVPGLTEHYGASRDPPVYIYTYIYIFIYIYIYIYIHICIWM